MPVDALATDLRSRGVDVSGLDRDLDAMSAAGVIAITSRPKPGPHPRPSRSISWQRYVRLSDVGRTFIAGERSLGRGVILDDPYSSSLLVMGLREGLIEPPGSRAAFRRELSRGRSADIQREMLRALVLFEDVVVPGDKAATDYFDWRGLEDTGLRITPHLGPRQLLRFQALTDPATVVPTGDDRLSAWDNVLRAYLRRRRLPTFALPDDFATSTELGYALSAGATAEDRELFIPDVIEYRVREFIANRWPFTRIDDQRIVAELRGAFWQVETFFHLRYLESLTENEWLPGIIRTRLGSVRTVTDADVASTVERGFSSGTDADIVYSIFLDEILTLPQPETLHDAIEWRAKPHIAEFRDVFFRWHDAISAGTADEASLRHELYKISRSARRLKGWEKAAKMQTYLSLPATVALSFVAAPVGGGVGIGLAAIGVITQKWIGRGQRKHRWMLVGEL